MNDLEQSFLEYQATEQARLAAENWLAAFETALASRDAARIAARATGLSRDSIYARALARKPGASG